MSSNNIYNFHHKGLRKFLGELNLLYGSTNFENQIEIEKLQEKTLKLMSLLSSHSFIEDKVILKYLTEIGISVPSQDQEDHFRLDSIIFKVISGLQSINSQTERVVEKGKFLYLLFNQFQGEYFLHMHKEETVTLPIILENLNIEELNHLQGLITKKTPPPILLEWFRHSLPALNYIERIASLRPVLDNSSEETMAITLSIAKNVLSESEFMTLTKGLDLKMV